MYEPEEQSDGYRVLVDKLWPRGIKKEDLQDDYWAKEIAPSSGLRQWYHQNEEKNWEEFRQRYLLELKENPAAKLFLNQIKDKEKVTLLYASKNTMENHALVLQEYIRKHLV